MLVQNSPVAALLIVATCLLGALAHTAWRRRQIPEAKLLALVMITGSVWTLTYAFELISTQLGSKLILRQLGFFGAVLVPTCWFFLIMRFSGHDRRVGRWSPLFTWLLLEPAVILILAWTNDFHSLYSGRDRWKSGMD